jgi:hypothetical protein
LRSGFPEDEAVTHPVQPKLELFKTSRSAELSLPQRRAALELLKKLLREAVSDARTESGEQNDQEANDD